MLMTAIWIFHPLKFGIAVSNIKEHKTQGISFNRKAQFLIGNMERNMTTQWPHWSFNCHIIQQLHLVKREKKLEHPIEWLTWEGGGGCSMELH